MKELHNANADASNTWTREQRFQHGVMSIMSKEELDVLPKKAVEAETDALSRVGTVVARPGEGIRIEMLEPAYLGVFGGLLETLLAGEGYCSGDEVLGEVLDGEPKKPLEFEPKEFRLVAVTVRADGLDIAYGRPFFNGKPLTGGRMVVCRRHLRFASSGGDDYSFAIEVCDASGDASKIVIVDLNAEAIKVNNDWVSVTAPRATEALAV